MVTIFAFTSIVVVFVQSFTAPNSILSSQLYHHKNCFTHLEPVSLVRSGVPGFTNFSPFLTICVFNISPQLLKLYVHKAVQESHSTKAITKIEKWLWSNSALAWA